MAERRAQQKYLPPDYDPNEHGSLNSYHGQHHLRDRARKLDRGILVIRFELPFNIFCGHCEKHIARGVRFNAEKYEVGVYIKTKIWQFSMKCHLCGGLIVIKTDPQNADYVIVSGARRKLDDFIVDSEDTVQLMSADQKALLAKDPLFRVEYEQTDKQKATKRLRDLATLIDIQDRHLDDFAQSQKLRADNRV